MKQFRSLAALFIVLAIPLGYAGLAAAETLSVTQEIKVTAIVPGHRDIVVNTRGDIVSIYSNTPEDITPQVYLMNVTPQNRKELTPKLLQDYRRYVPVGTAKYGTLYEAKFPAQLTFTLPAWRDDRGA